MHRVQLVEAGRLRQLERRDLRIRHAVAGEAGPLGIAEHDPEVGS